MGGYTQDYAANSTIAVAASAGNLGVAPNAGGTANTKGAWSQIVASTAADCSIVCVQTFGLKSTTTVNGISVDIGVGAAGSEKVLIPDLLHWYNAVVNNFIVVNSVVFPLNIPSGTRIAARAQADLATPGTTLQCNVILFDPGFGVPEGCAGVDAIGFVAATTTGTAVTPGASGAKGSYAQLVASTARDYCGFFLSEFQGVNAGYRTLDIAIGAAASEQIIIPDIFSFNPWFTSFLPYYPVPVPSGVRLSMRVSDTKPDTSNGLVVIYGVYQ